MIHNLWLINNWSSKTEPRLSELKKNETTNLSTLEPVRWVPLQYNWLWDLWKANDYLLKNKMVSRSKNHFQAHQFCDLLIYRVSNSEICFSCLILSASNRSGLSTECFPVWVCLVRVSVAWTWTDRWRGRWVCVDSWIKDRGSVWVEITFDLLSNNGCKFGIFFFGFSMIFHQ